ncbi:autotransporter domain-containing protein [Bradyrhizobium sp. CB1650]|uniref:autotransporter family protein n=1 Tax=Bradyrhizobium sp. CB1650 TaxID=3039153 RepID=UPI0024355305|nr:autotransporter domain-containing protein [Bradyrhizobium sp. CB1650]WGD52346.1 autotransporter domain-containing protein [Bradyrhizobium sp. CB1650]
MTGPGSLGAFIASAVTFTNTASGSIVSLQDTGVLANNGGTFNNAGTITGQNIGINVNNGLATVTNSGSITGIVGAGLLFSGTFDNTVTNSGTITGQAGQAITFAGGNDTFNQLAGAINGNVDMGDGANRVNISGGSINGTITAGVGADQLTWTGGVVAGAINLGAGDDVATLRNLTTADLAALTKLDGGQGVDHLVFDNTTASGVERFANWEFVELANNSKLTFAGTLTLGDSGTGTGALSIDPTSTVFAGNGNHAIVPFTTGQLVMVTNAGLIDLTNGPPAATDSLTIVGNYVGQSGRLALQSVLAGDGSPSDKLVISTGAGTGATGISVTNLGGAGALTTGDGILVVQAVNGGSTAAGAFSLSGAVAAGPFEYLLFRGGASAGTTDNWYLRSTAPPGPQSQPSPVPIVPSPQAPVVQTPSGPVVPLFRPEVALDAIVPEMARQLALATLGTFHERQGDQRLLIGTGDFPAAWGRVFGQHTEQSWTGTVLPSISGTVWGLQTGLDLFSRETPNGDRDRLGIFYGHGGVNGDVRGFAIGQLNSPAGTLTQQGDSLGGYWTHLGPTNWYLDAVVMNTWLTGNTRTFRGIGAIDDGSILTASLESGYPLPLGASWTIEPQAQIIWQRTSLDSTQDLFSTINYGASDVLTGRLGVRLQGALQVGATPLQPYLRANLWHTFDATDSVTFALTPIGTAIGASAYEVGGGVMAQLTTSVGLYINASYLGNLGSEHRRAAGGNAGLRVTW